MMGWDWHAKRLARMLQGEDLAGYVVGGTTEPTREIIEAILHLGEMAHVDLASFAPIKHFNCRCVEPEKQEAQAKTLHDFDHGDCACVDGDCLVLVDKVTRRGIWLWDASGGRCWVSRRQIGEVKLVQRTPKCK